MSLTKDDTEVLHDFDQYDQEKLLSEIEVLNKEIARFGTKNFGTVPNLVISTPMTRATTPRHIDTGMQGLQMLVLHMKMACTIRKSNQILS